MSHSACPLLRNSGTTCRQTTHPLRFRPHFMREDREHLGEKCQECSRWGDLRSDASWSQDDTWRMKIINLWCQWQEAMGRISYWKKPQANTCTWYSQVAGYLVIGVVTRKWEEIAWLEEILFSFPCIQHDGVRRGEGENHSSTLGIHCSLWSVAHHLGLFFPDQAMLAEQRKKGFCDVVALSLLHRAEVCCLLPKELFSSIGRVLSAIWEQALMGSDVQFGASWKSSAPSLWRWQGWYHVARHEGAWSIFIEHCVAFLLFRTTLMRAMSKWMNEWTLNLFARRGQGPHEMSLLSWDCSRWWNSGLFCSRHVHFTLSATEIEGALSHVCPCQSAKPQQKDHFLFEATWLKFENSPKLQMAWIDLNWQSQYGHYLWVRIVPKEYEADRVPPEQSARDSLQRSALLVTFSLKTWLISVAQDQVFLRQDVPAMVARLHRQAVLRHWTYHFFSKIGAQLKWKLNWIGFWRRRRSSVAGFIRFGRSAPGQNLYTGPLNMFYIERIVANLHAACSKEAKVFDKTRPHKLYIYIYIYIEVMLHLALAQSRTSMRCRRR